MDKLVFIQWKLKNNDKPKHPKYIQLLFNLYKI